MTPDAEKPRCQKLMATNAAKKALKTQVEWRKMSPTTYYKVTRPDGKAFHGNVTYREGKTFSARALPDGETRRLCSDTVLHASPKAIQALGYSTDGLNVALWEVTGKPVVEDTDKLGFADLTITRRVPDDELDAVFGFKFTEAQTPVHPADFVNEITDEDRAALKQWASVGASVDDSVWASVWASVRASVGASVWASVWDSVRASVWASVGASVGASVRASVGASVGASVWASVWDSVRASVWASVWAYYGSLFPGAFPSPYPFASGERLWRRGFIPVRAAGVWYLYHPVRNGKAVLIYKMGEGQ